ncbi:hypothetical protein [Lacibacter sp.]|uniref:hypothetical protein n=1 Tax=Lacibacter sp. TaxID=1915409 RepID=UPI002B4B4890|nr:hypothetical protein [Lacibacter sp.]HLP38969.1 hypothetical protein [Lacibacter sp.]
MAILHCLKIYQSNNQGPRQWKSLPLSAVLIAHLNNRCKAGPMQVQNEKNIDKKTYTWKTENNRIAA